MSLGQRKTCQAVSVGGRRGGIADVLVQDPCIRTENGEGDSQYKEGSGESRSW